MSREFIYHMRGLSKSYPGGKKVLENIHLSFYPDAKIGVLGVNGSGKSTLLRIMAGIDKEWSGEGWVAEGARVGYLPQEPQLDPSKNVRQNVEEGVAPQRAILDRYNELAMNYSDETADEMTRLQDEIEAKGLWDLDSKVEQAMDALRCPPDDWTSTTSRAARSRRVALCKLLLEQPELLLLDEPTNHLDAETIAWLEGHLRDYPGAILIVTHDRYFLDNVTGWILELDRGRGIPYEGNYSSWLEQKQKRLAQEGREEEARQRTIEREQRMGARLAEGAAGEVQGAHPALRGPRRQGGREGPDDGADHHSDRRAARQQRHRVREPHQGLRRQAPHRRALLQAAARRHRRRHRPERRRQDDALPHDHRPGKAGRRRDHDRRDREARLCRPVARLARADKTLYEEISGGNEILYLGKREINARAYCGAFNFKGSDQQKKVGVLSGGERNRVHLAKILKSGANVLLLDEPTNDLDVDTLRALEEALEDYAGCAVIISHDRWFLDRIATHILAFEGDSHVEWFEGNFADYEEDKKRRLGTDSTIPHRIKYKKFSR